MSSRLTMYSATCAAHGTMLLCHTAHTLPSPTLETFRSATKRHQRLFSSSICSTSRGHTPPAWRTVLQRATIELDEQACDSRV